MDSSNKLYHERKESDLWLLIQYERIQNVYAIIHSSVTIRKDNTDTGKIVHVRSGSSVLKASILLISDDRHFLEKEIRNLTRMPASLNLTKGSEAVEQRKPMETYKRKSQMTKSPTKYKPNATITRPMSSASRMSIYRNGSMNSSVEKHISVAIPPMTFNQGTQTDNKLSPMDSETVQSKNLSTFIQKLDYVIMENQQLKEMLNDLLSITSINTGNKEIQRKEENNDPHIVNFRMQPITEPIVLLRESSNEIAHIDDNRVVIETNDINKDNSNISHSNASRLSIVSNELICNISNIEANQSSASDSLNNTQSSNDIKHNSKEYQIDFADVTIGSNGTKVPSMVLDSIKSSSHCIATRKLLRALFTREVLATHSLRGKLLRGKIYIEIDWNKVLSTIGKLFDVDEVLKSNFAKSSADRKSTASKNSTKPTKNQLDASIVSDIVQFVSKEYGVTDTTVRSSISTKCAEENHSYRRQTEKQRLQIMENGSKENDLEKAHSLTI